MCSLKEILCLDKTCSGEYLKLSALSSEDETSVLCEISVTKSEISDQLHICENHRCAVFENIRKRSRRKICGVHECSALFKQFHSTSKVGDRHVTPEMGKQIAANTGVIIPVGTPICRLCRQNILADTVKDNNKTSNTCNSECFPNPDHEHIVKDAFRKRKTNHDLTPEDEPQSKRKQDSDYLSQQSTSLDSYPTSQEIETDSQVSEASFINISRLESLNNFLLLCNVSPVKKLTKQLNESSDRTKQRYLAKAKLCISAVLDTISPNEGDLLLESILDQQKTVHDVSLDVLKEIYQRAETWQFRRQILSIIVKQMTFEEAQTFIPGITSWKYYEAKKHSENEGTGLPVTESTEKREKVNPESLDHFIEFITSTHVIKDLPYGQRTLKLDSGEIINIPNVIRSMSSSALISQYQQLCDEDNVTPLGKSTLYRILTDCAASVRQSVEGLDNYVMEGSRAFQVLEELLETLQEKELRKKLLEAKRYLKADFKVHLAKQSDILQHCMGYALSSQGREFLQPCARLHEHKQHCESCIALDATLELILETVQGKLLENKDAIMFKVENAVNDVKELQKHIVRSKNQELARKNIADHIETNDVMITCDWAMKFLPRRYREGQLDWFAKRGINWHVSVSLIKLEHKLQTMTHLHIFRTQTSQDAATTTAIMTDVVEDLKTMLPNLGNVHIFSDNAGCYKSSVTLSSLRHDVGPRLASYNFSESQNGKGPCDRRAAHAKFVIKRYVNEGRDVTSAIAMKKALDKYGEQSYRVRVVDAIMDVDVEKNKETIKNISSFYNFCFERNGLRMWQAYNIGEGKFVPWENIKPSKNYIQLKVISDWAHTEIAETFEDPAQPHKQPKTKLMCPMEDCVREFKNITSLDHHILQGTCEYKLEKESLSTKCKIIYARKLGNAQPHCADINAANIFEDKDLADKDMGWALKVKKKKTIFSEKQKNYMKEQFQVGKKTGSKIDAITAAEQMRVLDKGFSKEEFLTAQQIGSFFSRLAQQERKADSLDLEAANDEAIKSKLKKEIKDTIDK